MNIEALVFSALVFVTIFSVGGAVAVALGALMERIGE